jgi:hypothetical protein
LGVVYGDIGTSPLYTMKEIFSPANGIPLDAPHLIGAVSVVFWGLMMVVTLKYVLLILRADNRGRAASWHSPRWQPKPWEAHPTKRRNLCTAVDWRIWVRPCSTATA